MLKMWNMWLVFATFLLAIFGTFLTRSGVISSVHAFAQSSIGSWFVVFMAVTFVACLFFFIKNRSHLRTEHRLESLASRESSFVFNNLLLLLACFVVLLGTMFPLLSEWVKGTKVTVGPPYFNTVMIPVALLLLFLTGVGPLLAWRKTSLGSLKRNFSIPAALAVLTAVLLLAFGQRPWQELSAFYSFVAWVLAALVGTTILSEFVRGGRVISRHTGQNLAASMVQLTRRNTRRYGGYVVHFGVVLVILGIAGSAFNQQTEKELGFGDKMEVAGYTLVCRSYTEDDNPNYSSASAILDVYKNGAKIDTLYPERRFYKASQQPQSMVAIRSRAAGDLYVVFTGTSDQNRPIIRVHYNPLVMWLWWGVLIVLAGTGLALVPNMQAAAVAPKPAPERAVAEVVR